MKTADALKPRSLPLAPTSVGSAAPRIFEDICNEIRARLSRGELKPGDKLPSERDLAESFGSSRAAVREALRNLERGGIIEQRKGIKGGTYITRANPTIVTQSLNDLLSFGGISVDNLTEIRGIVLDAAVRLACDRGTPDDFDLLDASIDRTALLTREGRLEERQLQLLEFYRLLSCAAHNEVLVILVAALTDMVLKLMARDGVGQRATTLRTHRQIVRALRAGDKEKATTLMSAHMERMHSHFATAARHRSGD
ncbi:MAG: FCD domain-containing protein [Burkholderiaceae bacterium]|nr:FCD domain-containing protein [Burkholderiaceae bacterium]